MDLRVTHMKSFSPSSEISEPEQDIDEILEKKKNQAQRLFANKSKLMVKGFEEEMLHLRMVKGEMKIVSANKKEQS